MYPGGHCEFFTGRKSVGGVGGTGRGVVYNLCLVLKIVLRNRTINVT
jgi:hypothetical protein